MSISNRKPGEKKEAPAEPLKRSIAGCMKAIARKQDLEVTFASDRPALMGDKARLPARPPGAQGRQGPPARAAAKAVVPGRRDPSRSCGFHGASPRLPRFRP